jgi:hypothetical protein
MLPLLLACLAQSLQLEPVDSFIAATIAAERALAPERARYAFVEIQRNWDGPDDKTPRERRYENLFLEGALYRKLIERDGKPLSPKEQREVEAAMAKEREKRREVRRSGRKFLPGIRNLRAGSLSQIHRLHTATDDGLTDLNGEPARKISFTPNPAVTPKDEAEKEIQAYSHVYWIHPTEHAILRHDLKVERDGVDLLPGSTSTSIYARPEPSMPRLEVQRTIEFTTKVFGVRKATGRQEHSLSSFRRFDAESTITFEEPPNP